MLEASLHEGNASGRVSAIASNGSVLRLSANELAAPLTLPPPQWAALEAAYATPARAYHNLGHVHEVLRHYAAVAAGPGWTQPAEVYLAVLYHDAIYEAGRSDNEARSAELALAHIARWLPDMGVDAPRVAELIRLTARHGQLAGDALDRDAALFLDCDMAILGAEPAVFDAYDRGIATEYRGQVPGMVVQAQPPALPQGAAGPRAHLPQRFLPCPAGRAGADQPAPRGDREALSAVGGACHWAL